MRKRLYTAVGHFRRKAGTDGQSYPVILVNREEYPVDMQEMTVWTALSWRLLDFDQLEREYDKLAWECGVQPRRTLESCLYRLVTRGLAASGSGDTDSEALYDLLAGLYVAPLSASPLLRLTVFLKLTVLRGVPASKAQVLLRRDRLSGTEAQVMALARQELLSTAELVKCAEVGARDISTGEKLMEALYDDDDTTCDDMPALMRAAKSREEITMAVANLYLRKQIVLQRV